MVPIRAGMAAADKPAGMAEPLYNRVLTLANIDRFHPRKAATTLLTNFRDRTL
jgi:hypothetical protein